MSQSMKKPATCMASRRSGGITSGPEARRSPITSASGSRAAAPRSRGISSGSCCPSPSSVTARSAPRVSASANPRRSASPLPLRRPRRSTSRAGLGRHLRAPVGGTVVHDEHGPVAARGRHHRAERRRLVEHGDDDQEVGHTARADRSVAHAARPSRIAVRHPPRAMPWTSAVPPPAPTVERGRAGAERAEAPVLAEYRGERAEALGHPEAGSVAQVLAEERGPPSRPPRVAVARGVAGRDRRPRAGSRRRARAAPASADRGAWTARCGAPPGRSTRRRRATSAWTVAPRASAASRSSSTSSVAPSPITGPL